MNKPFEKPRTIALAVQAEIRELIARGTLLPGDRINEVSLSRMLDVSRGAIREALRSLENEHLVSYQAQKGASVRKLGSAEARELYEIRLGLAIVAAPHIAQNCTAEALAGLEDLYARMDSHIEEGSLPRFHETNRQFHVLLFSQAGNRRLLDLYMSLFDEVYLLRSLNFLSEGSTRRSQQGHGRIVDAISAGDQKSVCDAIVRHISTSRDFIVSLIEMSEREEEATDQSSPDVAP